MTEIAKWLREFAGQFTGDTRNQLRYAADLLDEPIGLSSSSLRTLVERLIEKWRKESQSEWCCEHTVKQCADELAALLSPVAVDDMHEDTATRTGDDGLSTSSRTASTDTKG